MALNYSYVQIGKITVCALNSRVAITSVRPEQSDFGIGELDHYGTLAQSYQLQLEAYRILISRSMSWRITAPLRSVGRWIYSMASAGRFFPDWICRVNARRRGD